MAPQIHLNLIGWVIRTTAIVVGLLVGVTGILLVIACVCLMMTPAACGMPLVAGFFGVIVSGLGTFFSLALALAFYQGGVLVQAGRKEARQGMMGFAVLYLILFWAWVYWFQPTSWWLGAGVLYALFFTNSLGQLLVQERKSKVPITCS